MDEFLKTRYEFSQWCSNLAASRAHNARLYELDAPAPPPVDVDPATAVNVFLQLHPEICKDRARLLAYAATRSAGTFIFAKPDWDEVCARVGPETT